MEEKNIQSDEIFEAKYGDGNYPMWDTLFEVRDHWEKIKKVAPLAGFGVINEGNDHSKDSYDFMLFVSGAGYDFYKSHWIPLYLMLYPWARDKYKPLVKEYLNRRGITEKRLKQYESNY